MLNPKESENGYYIETGWAINNKDIEPNIIDLRAQTIAKEISWFIGKPFRIKQYYVKWFSKFCRQLEYDNITEYCNEIIGTKKQLLISMWEKTLNHQFHTFDSIR